jgi:hypothetical protein
MVSEASKALQDWRMVLSMGARLTAEDFILHLPM